MKKRVFILLMTMIMMMGFNITVKAQADDGYDVDITEDCYDSENNTITIPSTFMSYGDPNFGDYTYPENGINAGYSMAETFYLVLTSVVYH